MRGIASQISFCHHETAMPLQAKKDRRIQALSHGRGPIFLELDQDDELTDYALDCVVQGFKQFPEAGFLNTDGAEIFEDGTNFTYREGWAFGYGSYTDVEYKGKLYKSGNGGNINAKTIRHIILAPTIYGPGGSLFMNL
jgi:hypothetical protein